MIKAKPPAVWQAVRNHMTRHVYDRMLKKTKLIRQIDDQTKLVYLHHETTQCFVKQSRDFVLLAARERVEPERYVLAATSVEIPEIPPINDIVRAKAYSSGWIIEPVLQNGQLYSMVSYLSQVDFGGVVSCQASKSRRPSPAALYRLPQGLLRETGTINSICDQL
ncbi:hypothetical protein OS493_038172 [Desmophyllum pertusum]|uniref:START domain-containing protein n=1 Tax=Desmophyllum pertusum TaxID=174260 RepID=A0A9X0D839_9CNID|nr:hypothetical protein OS493_038172 [Desmophyllum pertusum]